MAKRREYFVARAKVFVDRLCLGRGFNYNDIHVIPMGYAVTLKPTRADRIALAAGRWGDEVPVSNRNSASACAWTALGEVEREPHGFCVAGAHTGAWARLAQV